MQLSKLSYYSDFVVYPLVLVALTAANVSHVTWMSGTEWLGAAMAGLVLWTLMEYALHRIALHRMPYFSPMHGEHHAAPTFDLPHFHSPLLANQRQSIATGPPAVQRFYTSLPAPDPRHCRCATDRGE